MQKATATMTEFYIAEELTDEATDLMERGNVAIAPCLRDSVRYAYPQLWYASHTWSNISFDRDSIRGYNTYRCVKCGRTSSVDSSD
jgi:hypothetical protein